MTVDDDKAAVRRQTEDGVNRGQQDHVLDVLTPDYVHHMPINPEPLGLEAFQQMFSALLTASCGLGVVAASTVLERRSRHVLDAAPTHAQAFWGYADSSIM